MKTITKFQNIMITSRAVARNVVQDLKKQGFTAKVLDLGKTADQRWAIETDYKVSQTLATPRKPKNRTMVGLQREVAHSAPQWLNHSQKSRVIPVYVKQSKFSKMIKDCQKELGFLK